MLTVTAEVFSIILYIGWSSQSSLNRKWFLEHTFFFNSLPCVELPSP